MVRTFDPEYMEAIHERTERIREHVSAEEFCIKTAATIAHRELAPLFGDVSSPAPITQRNNHHARIET